MSDSPTVQDASTPDTPVDRWLASLGERPCGEDLEYDPTFLELTLAAAGKPATSFSEAEAPDWATAKALAETLLDRTHDLRVGLLWLRASINTEGVLALAEGMRLLGGWIDQYWSELHPALDPDDDDAFARISALGTLIDLNGLLGDVRQSVLLPDRRLGGLRVRDVEVALDRLPARADDTVHSRAEIEGLLTDLPELTARLRAGGDASLKGVLALQRSMNERFGIDRAVDAKPLRSMLETMISVLPQPEAETADDAPGDGQEGESSGDSPRAASSARRGGGGTGSIETRQDAIKAIQLVCAYLERSEPTNPAQLLLRRAERLIGKNFLQLVKDMAPDALQEVARIMGVDPDQISVDDQN